MGSLLSPSVLCHAFVVGRLDEEHPAIPKAAKTLSSVLVFIFLANIQIRCPFAGLYPAEEHGWDGGCMA
jgi:hypothetical protein